MFDQRSFCSNFYPKRSSINSSCGSIKFGRGAVNSTSGLGRVFTLPTVMLSVLLTATFVSNVFAEKPLRDRTISPQQEADRFAEEFFSEEDREFFGNDQPLVFEGREPLKQPSADGQAIVTESAAVTSSIDNEFTEGKPARNWYSAGGWSTLHQGPGNRDQARGAKIYSNYDTWHALEGVALLVAPAVSPAKTRLYQTSGLPKGSSNLHAFSMDGEPLWQAPAWTDADSGVDPCAVLSNVIVDYQGDLYLGDCNQVFSFKPNGELKWSVPLPEPQQGDWQPLADLPINALTTPVFTTQGHLLGVTNFGDVVVWDRASGKVLSQPMRLPGLLSPRSDVIKQPKTMWGEGFMDPDIRDWAWQLLFGGEMRSMNTPAVSQESGRIFVAATSTELSLGRLYGLDLIETDQGYSIEIGFATDFGIGSGSSPAMSPDDRYVYVSDEEGYVYSIDAASGTIVWQTKTNAVAGSAVIGTDGTVMVLQAWPHPIMTAMDGDTGDIKWLANADELANKVLPRSWILGDPVASANGIPTVTEDAILVPVVYGYPFWVGRTLALPVKNYVVAFNKETGKAFANVVEIPDDSSNTTPVLANGTIMSPLGTAVTSGYAQIAPLFNRFLPKDLKQTMPTGGIQVAIPVADE